MRVIDFDEYQKKRATFIRTRVKLGQKRAPSRRPRDEAERGLLLRLDKKRWEKWLDSGKLKKLAPRSYQLL